MSAWSDLPNARHIDWVVESVKTRPELWSAAWDVTWGEARSDPWNAARYVAVCHMRRDGDRVRYMAHDAVQGYHANAVVARGAIIALIAYDDCDQYLSMTADELRAWALMTEHPTAVLLLPMVVVREHIKQLETA